jgi:hypothetical protein
MPDINNDTENASDKVQTGVNVAVNKIRYIVREI